MLARQVRVQHGHHGRFGHIRATFSCVRHTLCGKCVRCVSMADDPYGTRFAGEHWALPFCGAPLPQGLPLPSRSSQLAAGHRDGRRLQVS